MYRCTIVCLVMIFTLNFCVKESAMNALDDVAETASDTAENVEEDLENFFFKTMPAYFEEAEDGVKVAATVIENKVLEEMQEFENFISDHCQCEGYSCTCCGHLDEEQSQLGTNICMNVAYIPNIYGITFTMTLNQRTLIHETISGLIPPPLCFGMPIVGDLVEICAALYDVSITSTCLHACLRIEGKMKGTSVVKYDFGCFDTVNDFEIKITENDLDNNYLQHIQVNSDRDPELFEERIMDNDLENNDVKRSPVDYYVSDSISLQNLTMDTDSNNNYFKYIVVNDDDAGDSMSLKQWNVNNDFDNNDQQHIPVHDNVQVLDDVPALDNVSTVDAAPVVSNVPLVVTTPDLDDDDQVYDDNLINNVSDFDNDTLYFDNPISPGKWIMINNIDNNLCEIQHIPIYFNVSYLITQGNLRSVQTAIVAVPDDSTGMGYCDKDFWTLTITWHSSLKNNTQKFVKLTLETGKYGTVETDVFSLLGECKLRNKHVKKSLPGFHVPDVLLECCYKDLNEENEDEESNATIKITIYLAQEDFYSLLLDCICVVFVLLVVVIFFKIIFPQCWKTRYSYNHYIKVKKCSFVP